MHAKSACCCAAAVLSICTWQPGNAQGQDLSRKTPALARSGSAHLRFTDVLRSLGLAGGVARTHAGCLDAPRPELAVENVTPQQALDALAKFEGPYRWVRADDAIVILPLGGAQTLLRAPVGSVRLGDTSNLNLSLQELLATPAIARSMKDLGLTFQGFRGGFAKLERGGSMRAPKPLDLSGVTLLQALNVLARLRGPGTVWAYDEYHCPEGTFQLTFVSQ